MSSLFNILRKSRSLLGLANVKMTAPPDTATTPQKQRVNRYRQELQQGLPQPYIGPNDELFENDDESEQRNESDSDNDVKSEQHSEPDSENDVEWPCICGEGLDTEGTWIRCDKSNCQYTWYHIGCVGLEEAPAGKWICPQCRARARKISVAKPDPKKKGTAIKVPQKKGTASKAPQKKEQVRWKGWKELPSDEEEQFKRNVESLWAAQIIPGKTRTRARQDAPYSDDGSKSTGNGASTRQQLQIDISKKQSTGKRVCLGTLYNEDPELEPRSGSSTDGQTASKSERTVGPKEMTIDDKATLPVEDDTQSTDSETVMDVDEIANYIIESAMGSDHVSNDHSVGSSRLTTPEGASLLLPAASNTTGERINFEPTEGDKALVSALRGNWVGQYFA